MKNTLATSKFLLTVMAAALAVGVCATHSHAAEGESPINDPPNAGQELPLWARPAPLPVQPNAQAVLARPDLAFKKIEMDASVLSRPVMLHNLGNAPSAATMVSCDGSTQQLEDAMKRAGGGSGEALIAYNVPALAAGASFQVPAQPPTADLTRWSCGIVSVAGESNTTNNQYVWRKASRVLPAPIRELRRTPGRVEP